MDKMKMMAWFFLLFGCCACTTEQEEWEGNMEADEVRVASAVNDFSMTPIKTRLEKGENLRFIVEAWKREEVSGNYSTRMVRQEVKGEKTSANFSFELPEPGDYRLLFWADYVDADATQEGGRFADKHYVTGTEKGLKSVGINNEPYLLNVNKDAFCTMLDFTKTAGQGVSIETQSLKRAVAVLELREKSEEAYRYSKSFSVSYEVPSAFNVETGPSEETASVNISEVQVLGGSEPDENGCYALWRDYIFAPAGEGYTIPTITLKGKNTINADERTKELTNVKVARNQTTVVKGSNLLVSEESIPTKARFTVTLGTDSKSLSPIFGGFNGRSSEGPQWTNTTFTDLVEWMSPSIVRYPGGTLANSWNWREGGIMGKEIKNPYYIKDLVKGLPAYTQIVYVMNVVNPTPVTGYSETTDESILKSDEVLQAKIKDALEALAEFETAGCLPIAVELGNELYFNNLDKYKDYGIYMANPEQYMAHVPVIARAIKEKYPEMKIILCTSKGGNGNSTRDTWNNGIFEGLAQNGELNNLVHGFVQHHYIKKDVGSQAVIGDNTQAEAIVAQGFQYVKDVQADYERIPEGKKLWITEYGLEEAGNAMCDRWVNGLEYLAMSMSWINWADKVETIQLQHITLTPGVLNEAKDKLSSVGIIYGELLRAVKGADRATPITVTAADVADTEAAGKLYGWKFTSTADTDKQVLLLLNPTATELTDVDLSETAFAGGMSAIQYWSDKPYEDVAGSMTVGNGINREEMQGVRHALRPFSLSVFVSASENQ